MLKLLISLMAVAMIFSGQVHAKSSPKIFAHYALKKMLKKRNLHLAKNESMPLVYDKEDFTYSQTLTFKTKRGYFCKGSMSFEVDWNHKIERDSLFTNLNCYSVKNRKRSKRRGRRS